MMKYAMLSALWWGAVLAGGVSTWNCAPVTNSTVYPGILYRELNCTGETPKGPVGPMLFHVTATDLAEVDSGRLELYPQAAAASAQLQTLDEMAPPKALTGINGGYFFRVDVAKFLDDVCWGKTRAEALSPADSKHPNNGIGDGLLIRNGTLLSSNCDLIGNSVPALLVLNGTGTNIVIQSRGAPAPPGVINGIAAGPNLISEDASGRPFINIKGLNVNIIEHSSNTAVGLVRRSPGGPMSTMFMVVSNGRDSCKSSDPTCGLNAMHMAYFLKDFLGVNQAMEMDQGGSSTMWVQGLGIVSNKGDSPRKLYSSLFVNAA